MVRARRLYLICAGVAFVTSCTFHRSDLFHADSIGFIESTAKEVAHGHLNGVFQGEWLNVDASVLQRGDILLCHNPGGSYGYWTHAVMYVGGGQAVDAYDFVSGTKLKPLSEYSRYARVAVLRAKATPEVRVRAADFARHAVGTAYDPFAALEDEHSQYCSKLIWQAFARQGLYICPHKAWVLPDDLQASPQLRMVTVWGSGIGGSGR